MPVETLFKYGALTQHSRALFATPTVWFSSATMLNDPFELRPWFLFDGTEEQIVERLVESIRRQSPDLPLMKALETAIRIFQEGHHRNPLMWEALRQDLNATFAKEIGVYCLSTTVDSILMWSHYARNHEGYCLEFKATDHTPFFGEAQEVKYQTQFPVVNFFTTPRIEQVDLLFLTKFEGWRYENEFRIVGHHAGPGLQEYPEELFVSVTFGLKMAALDRALIRQWLTHRHHPVELYETSIDQQEFKVVRKRVQ